MGRNLEPIEFVEVNVDGLSVTQLLIETRDKTGEIQYLWRLLVVRVSCMTATMTAARDLNPPRPATKDLCDDEEGGAHCNCG